MKWPVKVYGAARKPIKTALGDYVISTNSEAFLVDAMAEYVERFPRSIPVHTEHAPCFGERGYPIECGRIVRPASAGLRREHQRLIVFSARAEIP